MNYFDCYLIPLPADKLSAYKDFSYQIAKVFREYGAIRIVDSVLDDDVSNGAEFHAENARDALKEEKEPLRGFQEATAVHDGEIVIISWTEWPSKAIRDVGLAKALADARVQSQEGQEVLFEGRRLIAGSFHGLFDV